MNVAIYVLCNRYLRAQARHAAPVDFWSVFSTRSVPHPCGYFPRLPGKIKKKHENKTEISVLGRCAERRLRNEATGL